MFILILESEPVVICLTLINAPVLSYGIFNGIISLTLYPVPALVISVSTIIFPIVNDFVPSVTISPASNTPNTSERNIVETCVPPIISIITLSTIAVAPDVFPSTFFPAIVLISEDVSADLKI